MTDKSNPTPHNLNRFEFATIAAQRAKQLQLGCVPKLEGSALKSAIFHDRRLSARERGEHGPA